MAKLNQRARAVGELSTVQQILFYERQIFAKAAVTVNAIQRDVLTAVGFPSRQAAQAPQRITGE